MAKKTSSKEDTTLEELKSKSIISEAYLTGLFWCNPELYDYYGEDKLNTKTFLNKPWAFYFGLGRKMHEGKIKIFDEISVEKTVDENNVRNIYEKYGEFDTVNEMMEEVKGFQDNIDKYYNEVKKYEMIIKLRELLGNKVTDQTEKYNIDIMTRDQIYTYWNDKFNQLSIDGEVNYTESYLLDGLKESAKEWDENPDVGLPFFRSSKMTAICTGWDYGHVYIYGGFGGSGKTSLTFNKVIMSCIENKEKLLVIANEQTCKEFQKLLIVTALGIIGIDNRKSQDAVENYYLKRQRLNEGSFSEEEWEKINAAISWIEELAGTDNDKNANKLVAFVFMEDYVIRDVKKIVKRYNNRGYRSVLIDTGKPSDNETGKQRWEAFTDDFKDLYKIARPDAGGLNIRMWVNVQLADTHINRRFLKEDALGDSKKIKNEASVLFLGRHCFDDEYEDGSYEIEYWKWVKTDEDNPLHDQSKEYNKDKFKLEKGKHYFLLFTGKNRRGMDYRTGQEVLVFVVDLNRNMWVECGWTTIIDDKGY